MASSKTKHVVVSVIIAAALIILILSFIQGTKNVNTNNQQTKEITIQKADATKITINAEIADDDAEKQKGLMYRTQMGENEGMIFLFDKEQPLIFWMKNTLIPLDMIFTNSNGTIISIAQNAQPCKTQKCETYASEGNAQYVLELNGGFCNKQNIQKGDKLIIP